MKRLYLFTLIFGGLFLHPLFSQDDKSKEAADYCNAIAAEQQNLGNKFLEFSNKLLTTDDLAEKDQARVQVLKEIELSLRRIRNMPDFKGDANLKEETIKVFESYKLVHENEYVNIVKSMVKTKSSYEALEKYIRMQMDAEEKINKNAQRMVAAERKFAEKYHVILVENSMQKQFDKIMECNTYSRSIFLEYLKVAAANERWWNAMQKDEYDLMEKERTALDQLIGECKLNSIGDFYGTTELRDIAIERVEYYKKLSQKDYPEFYKILSGTTRTKEDIEYINDVIDDFNNTDSELNRKFNEAERKLKLESVKVDEQ